VQATNKSACPWTPCRSVCAKESYDRHLVRLLRPRRDRPCRSPAEQRDEVAPGAPKIPLVESMASFIDPGAQAAHGNSLDHLVGAGE
jgi:hypothetical protein